MPVVKVPGDLIAGIQVAKMNPGADITQLTIRSASGMPVFTSIRILLVARRIERCQIIQLRIVDCRILRVDITLLVFHRFDIPLHKDCPFIRNIAASLSELILQDSYGGLTRKWLAHGRSDRPRIAKTYNFE